MDELQVLKRKLEREKKARKQAEAILEKKALELYHTNERLQKLNESLEQKILERTRQVKDGQKRYKQIIDTASDLIYRATPDGIITYVNPVGKYMLGYEKEEVLGCHFSSFVQDDYLEKTKSFYRDVIKEKKESSYFEFPIVSRLGQVYWLGQNVQLLFDQQGEIQEVSAVARDITERKQIQEALAQSEEKYRGIIENMALGLLEVDPDQVIRSANNSFCEMTGYTQEELIGKNARNTFLPEKYHAFNSQEEISRSTGQPGVYEVQIKKKNGELMWVLISGAPIYDAFTREYAGSIGIHFDMTARKKLELDLKEAKRIAEEAQEAEKQFLARMSHEIRTPLNAIIGMSHLLYDTNPSQEQKELLSIIKSSADILQALISDILEISKIHAGEIVAKAKEFDLPGLVRSIQKTFQHKLEKQPIEVVAIVDPSIKNLLVGDDLLLNQILLNLMGNSAKFTEKGEIGIEVKIKEQGQDFVEVEFVVFDTGIGIAEDKLGIIFENFKQADSEIRHKFGGTGLGLAITKQLVELQGGHIKVESELGKGTNFIFTLPYKDTGIPLEKKTEELSQALDVEIALNNVLVAEDNLMNRKYISSLFKKWNLPYQFAHNGQEAVELAQKQHFDLVFMDISMPIMNGYEATIKIRNTVNPNQNTPIIALTASAMVDKREYAFSIGMDDYLPKPFKPIQLLQTIQKHITQKLIPMRNARQKFKFNKSLDTDTLNLYYSDDLDYAAEMFETFLTYTAKEFYNLRPLVEAQKWSEVKKLAHKLKPSFAMVGLKSLGTLMASIEELASKNKGAAMINKKLAQSELAMKRFVPILKEELRKMQRAIA